MRSFNKHEDTSSMLLKPKDPCLLYIHVPFCEELCPYCSFHRVQFFKNEAQRYFRALRDEIRQYHRRGFLFSNVYVGGGTPTVDACELRGTLDLIRSLFPVREISVETNPNGLCDETIGILKNAGVNRLSVGVQSFDDDLLRKMGRSKKYGLGEDIRKRLAAVNGIFKTLNIDMLFNLPGQTMTSLQRDLDILLDINTDQITFYPLMTAPRIKATIAHTMGKPDSSLVRDYYEHLHNTLRNRYRSGSVWCFSRNDTMIDEYIIDNDNYVGAGSGAFSYIDGVIYATTFSVTRYIQRIDEGLTGITHSKSLTLKQRMQYDFMVKLFGLKMDRDYLVRKYGFQSRLMMLPELAFLRLAGGLHYDGHWIRLTKRGMYLWVILMSEFFNSLNAFREHMRDEVHLEGGHAS